MVEPSGGERTRGRAPGSTARYADRYFGSAGRGEPDPETIDLIAGEVPAPRHDETGNDPRASGPPPWHSHRVARVTVVGALVLGALGGAYGWDRWQARETELAARAAVEVTSEVTMFGQSSKDPNEITLSVRLHNDGQYPVTLTGLESTDPRLTPGHPDFDPMEIEPGSSDVVLASFAYDCGADNDLDAAGDRDDAVVAHVRAVDGTEHDRALSIDGLGVGFSSFLTNECAFQTSRPRFMDSYPELIDAAPLGEDAVTVGVRFSTFSGPEGPLPNIVDVRSRGTAFVASLDVESLVTPVPGGPDISVTWTVGDCAAAFVADESDMVLRVTGQLPIDDRTTTINAPPSTGLVVELVRLTERTCR